MSTPKNCSGYSTGSTTGILDRTKSILQRPEFERETLRLKEEYREKVLQWCHTLGEEGIGALAFPRAYGGEDDMGKYSYAFEALGYHDLSLTIKFGRAIRPLGRGDR